MSSSTPPTPSSPSNNTSSTSRSFADELLTSSELQRKTLTKLAVAGTAVGALGGVLYAMPRRFRSERGALWHALKALGGGTALCLASAAVVVQSVKWSLGVDSMSEFAAVMRRAIRPFSQRVIRQPPPPPPSTSTTTPPPPTQSPPSTLSNLEWILGEDEEPPQKKGP